MKLWILLSCVLIGLPLLAMPGAAATQNSPDFILGYATSVLQRSHSLDGFSLDFELDSGALVVDFAVKPEIPFDTIGRSLLKIEGVKQTRILVAGEVVSESVRPPIREPAHAPSPPSPTDAAGDPSADLEPEPEPESGYDFLSPFQMFRSLLADPRWPHFAVSHQWYIDDDEIGRVGSANFGESFALVRSPKHAWGQWEFGLQAGVFSVFDLEADSNDLVNSDFLVGLTATHRVGDFTTMLRIYHQSSHLGDEFLLRNRVDRVNLSFEVLDLLVSFEPTDWFRLYAGGGIIVHRIPLIDRGIVQGGTEFRSPVAFVDGYLRPIAGVDFQIREESDWKLDTSFRGGFQVEHPFLRRIQLQILAEFYSGRSPNGQFYERRIETGGIGLHLGF